MPGRMERVSRGRTQASCHNMQGFLDECVDGGEVTVIPCWVTVTSRVDKGQYVMFLLA